MSAIAYPANLQGPIVAYVCSEQGASLARDLAVKIGAAEPQLYGGGVSGAARVSSPNDANHLLLTEIGNLPLDIACESVAEIHSSGARTIVFGQQNDITTYRAIVAAGAVDYFPFPVTAEEIVTSLSRQPANSPAPTHDPSLRIAVTGSNGGVGASILAQNLAYVSAMQKSTPRQTALIDADLRFSSVACDLNRSSTHGFLEALSAPDRVDETFLKATMDQIEAHLFLYSDYLHHSGDIGAADKGLTRLIPRLSEHFEASIIDAPRDLVLRCPDILANLQHLVLVVPGGYSGVHSASRMLDHLREVAPDLRIVPVLADLRKDAGLKAKDLSKALGQDVAHVLPRADAGMKRAQRSGTPLAVAQPRGPYGKAVTALWADIVKPTRPVKAGKTAAPKGFLRRVMG